jgi:hypothetical protein
MYLRHWRIALTIALTAPLVACSGSDGDEPSTTQPDPKDPNRWGDAARPCGNLDTGYPGDENCILPPPEGTGFQFHYGPKEYTEAEMSKWLIGPGEEVTDCILIDTPNEHEIFFNEYHSRLRPGSHHMLLYVLPDDLPDSDQPQRACSQGFTQRNLFGAQTEILDVKRQSAAPENVGLAVRLPAKQQGIMQLHFFNTHPTDHMLKEAWANLIYTDPANVTQLADPIFFISGLAMNVALGGPSSDAHRSLPRPHRAFLRMDHDRRAPRAVVRGFRLARTRTVPLRHSDDSRAIGQGCAQERRP